MAYKAVFNEQCLYHFNGIHDKLGRFGSGDGDGDGIIDDNHNQRTPKKTSKKIVGKSNKKEGKNKKPGSDFRTPELDEEYKKITSVKIPEYYKLGWYDDNDVNLVEKWGKEGVNAADVGLKALNKVGRDGYDEKVGITNSDRSWFMFEDQTVGYPDIAYLACQGKSVDEINSIMKSYKACMEANCDFDAQYKYKEAIDKFGSFENYMKAYPYPNASAALNEYEINGEGDPYIDACVEYAKEYTNVKHYVSDGENFIKLDGSLIKEGEEYVNTIVHAMTYD